MSMEKTIEEKWLAVKEFLLDKMKEDDDVSWHDQHGVWQAGWWKPNWKLTVRLVDRRISETLLMEQDAVSQSANIPVLYALFGLAERDAVEAYKASLQSDLKSMTAIVSSVKKGEQPDYVHVSKLDELQARNTALVAALEKIRYEHGYRYTYGDGFGNVVEKRINSVGVMVNTALAANTNTEKGGVQG